MTATAPARIKDHNGQTYTLIGTVDGYLAYRNDSDSTDVQHINTAIANQLADLAA